MEIQNTEIPGLKIISPFLQVIIRGSLYQMAAHLINYYTQNMLL